MKKIMFNDRFGLTQAVIERRKTMTRRIMSGYPMSPSDRIEDASYSVGSIGVVANRGETVFVLKPRYKIGDIVAVAQSYRDAGISREYIDNDPFGGLKEGWGNKMFVRANMMPHRIRITGIRCERLQDISNEDCLDEGIIDFIHVGPPARATTFFHAPNDNKNTFNTPREAFAALIDNVSGRGTWELNPWVVVYEFELFK